MNDKDLLYAATVRCRCGAGVAYVPDSNPNAWVCAAVLKDEVSPLSGEHDAYHFGLYKIREETSINNTGGQTTRPSGTIARTVGKATCPECKTSWESEPYIACGQSHHWFSGPCPNCGYAVGSAGVHRSDEGPAIEHRFSDVVLDD